MAAPNLRKQPAISLANVHSTNLLGDPRSKVRWKKCLMNTHRFRSFKASRNPATLTFEFDFQRSRDHVTIYHRYVLFVSTQRRSLIETACHPVFTCVSFLIASNKSNGCGTLRTSLNAREVWKLRWCMSWKRNNNVLHFSADCFFSLRLSTCQCYQRDSHSDTTV